MDDAGLTVVSGWWRQRWGCMIIPSRGKKKKILLRAKKSWRKQRPARSG